MKNKRLVFETDSSGSSYVGSMHLSTQADYVIGCPIDSWIVADCKIIPKKEGYRIVTPEEMTEFNKPECVEYWFRQWVKAEIKDHWHQDNIYIIPEDYVFEKWVDVTKEEQNMAMLKGKRGER